jgi:hypothetical protein
MGYIVTTNTAAVNANSCGIAAGSPASKALVAQPVDEGFVNGVREKFTSKKALRGTRRLRPRFTKPSYILENNGNKTNLRIHSTCYPVCHFLDVKGGGQAILNAARQNF